jgi:hypothetical protein
MLKECWENKSEGKNYKYYDDWWNYKDQRENWYGKQKNRSILKIIKNDEEINTNC